ncbi:hypothetical protein S83_031382 [Arachis hypogaea]
MNFVLGTRRIPEKAKRVVVLVQNQIGEARFGAELFRDVLKLSVFLKPRPPPHLTIQAFAGKKLWRF